MRPEDQKERVRCRQPMFYVARGEGAPDRMDYLPRLAHESFSNWPLRPKLKLGFSGGEKYLAV